MNTFWQQPFPASYFWEMPIDLFLQYYSHHNNAKTHPLSILLVNKMLSSAYNLSFLKTAYAKTWATQN